MTLQILVGADPELFMFKDGKPVSAHNMIPGDKKHPHKVPHGAVQVDGLALEFNIDPAKDEQEFVNNLTAVMATLKEMVPEYELRAVPVAEFGAKYLAEQPMEALELGCEPDFCAWTNGAVNPRPNGAADFRTGAGHVHIGWTNDVDPHDPQHMEACVMAAKQLDWALGLGSLMFDQDQKRRTLYGAAGCFRPKPYGVEYRTLSNAWLQSKEMMAWVFRVTTKAMQDLAEGVSYGKLGSEAQTLIAGSYGASTVKMYFDKTGLEYPPGINPATGKPFVVVKKAEGLKVSRAKKVAAGAPVLWDDALNDLF